MAIPSGVIRDVRSVSTVLVDLDNSFVASFSHSCTLSGFSNGGREEEEDDVGSSPSFAAW
jgi:hypothetical protein